MIDTRIVKDCLGTTDLCKTFAYDEILCYDIGQGKQIKEIRQEFDSNNVEVIFTDDTSYSFTSDKTVNHFEIDETNLKAYVGDKVLKQVETERIYNTAVDLIAGYNNGKPYSRFTYVEVDKPETPDISNIPDKVLINI